jgi:hypothetical protein
MAQRDEWLAINEKIDADEKEGIVGAKKKELRDITKKFYDKKVNGPFKDLVYDEISKTVTEWPDLQAMQRGFVAAHSLVVLWLVTQDPHYVESTKR